MPIFYQVQERYSHFAPGNKRKYYLIGKSWDKIGRKELTKDMTRHCSLSPSEASSAIDYLFQTIPRFLLMGHTVNLPGLGSFGISIQSEGSERKEEATWHKIKKVKIVFRPGKEFKKSIEEAPLEQFPKLAKPLGVPSKKESYIMDIQKEQAVATARRCIEEGLDIELTSKLTGLSEEEIRVLSGMF